MTSLPIVRGLVKPIPKACTLSLFAWTVPLNPAVKPSRTGSQVKSQTKQKVWKWTRIDESDHWQVVQKMCTKLQRFFFWTANGVRKRSSKDPNNQINHQMTSSWPRQQKLKVSLTPRICQSCDITILDLPWRSKLKTMATHDMKNLSPALSCICEEKEKPWEHMKPWPSKRNALQSNLVVSSLANSLFLTSAPQTNHTDRVSVCGPIHCHIVVCDCPAASWHFPVVITSWWLAPTQVKQPWFAVSKPLSGCARFLPWQNFWTLCCRLEYKAVFRGNAGVSTLAIWRVTLWDEIHNVKLLTRNLWPLDLAKVRLCRFNS